MDERSANYIVDLYTCARLDGDTAATNAVLHYALDHDQDNPDQPKLTPLLLQAADRTPPKAFQP